MNFLPLSNLGYNASLSNRFGRQGISPAAGYTGAGYAGVANNLGYSNDFKGPATAYPSYFGYSRSSGFGQNDTNYSTFNSSPLLTGYKPYYPNTWGIQNFPAAPGSAFGYTGSPYQYGNYNRLAGSSIPYGATGTQASQQNDGMANMMSFMQVLFASLLRNRSASSQLVSGVATPPPPPTYSGGNSALYWGDPHLVGFDGEKYDVMGQSGKVYNMLSDQGLQYNTKFETFGSDGATIISEAGITVGKNKVHFDRSGKAPTVDGKEMQTGEEIQLDNGGKATWDGAKLLVNTGEYTIDLKVTKDPNGDYLDSNVKINEGGPFKDNVAPHGLLGQTADGIAGEKNSGKDQGKQGGTVIDGTVEQYEVQDVFQTDFKSEFNRFDAAAGTGFEHMTQPVQPANATAVATAPTEAATQKEAA